MLSQMQYAPIYADMCVNSSRIVVLVVGTTCAYRSGVQLLQADSADADEDSKANAVRLWTRCDYKLQMLVLLWLLSRAQYHLLTSMSCSGGRSALRARAGRSQTLMGCRRRLQRQPGVKSNVWQQEQSNARAAGEGTLNRKARTVCNMVTCLTTSWSEWQTCRIEPVMPPNTCHYFEQAP